MGSNIYIFKAPDLTYHSRWRDGRSVWLPWLVGRLSVTPVPQSHFHLSPDVVAGLEWSCYHSLVFFLLLLLLALSPLPYSFAYLSSMKQQQVLFERRVLRMCQPRLQSAGVSLCRRGRPSCVWSSCSQLPQAWLDRITWFGGWCEQDEWGGKRKRGK